MAPETAKPPAACWHPNLRGAGRRGGSQRHAQQYPVAQGLSQLRVAWHTTGVLLGVPWGTPWGYLGCRLGASQPTWEITIPAWPAASSPHLFCLHGLLQGHNCLGTLPTVQHTTVLDCQMPMLVLQRDRHCNVQGPWRVQIAIASVSPVLSKTALRDSRSLAAEVLTPAGSAAAAASPPSLGSEASFWAAPSAWKSTLMAPHATRLSQLRSGRWPPWAHAPPRAPVSCIDPPKKSLTQRRCSPPLSTSCAQIASRCPPPAPPLRSP